MGQAISKIRKFHQDKQQQATPNQNYQLPRTVDSSGDPVAADAKLLDGRQFKKSGSPVYPFPNDKGEFERLNLQHYILRYILQKNYRAPVTELLEKGIKVLDAGCGTGVWTMELAKEFPKSTFTGTDITNVFAGTASMAPPNVTFVEADTTKGLPFEDNTFDYVFQRAQVFCFKEKEWPFVLKELLRVCKPGGYMESFEACLPVDCGPALTQQVQWFKSVLELRNVSDRAFVDESLYLDAGWTELDSWIEPWRLGWGEDERLGELSSTNYCTMIIASRPQITAALGISEDEYDEVCNKAVLELTTKNEFRPHPLFHNRVGRKPLQN